MDIGGGNDGSSLGDIPTRPMRVKILYTFDSDAKTSCLARFPDTQNIPVVAIDEQSQVGVIDLQQCIQAIVSASPEILSTLDTGDFTVYNFDFTEHDTPIVGQGRLSALLAGGQSGYNKSMITGRVCKNVPALFNNGVRETLEVKFKLTPLSRPVQSDPNRTADAFRSMSPATSAGFDPNAWNASMQQNRPIQPSNDYFSLDALAGDGSHDAGMLNDMFGMGSEGSGVISGLPQPGGVGAPESPTDSTFAFNPAFSAQSHSAPGSRAGSPIMRPGSNIHNEHLRHHSFSAQPSNFADQSRPVSRASVRSETNLSQQQRQASTQSYHHQPVQEQQPEVYYNEDGQSRKRARVTQTDWRGKSSFGAKSADLRVTAATASSMHMFRPIAKRPLAPGADLEPPPRVPTPVPQRTSLPRPRSQQPAGSRSMLRQASMVDSDVMSESEQLPGAQSSPEGSSPSRSVTAEYTPMDFPSSPPLVSGFNQPMPSSPGLPTLPPRMADSGYMSSNIMESLEDDENRSPDAEDFEMAAYYKARNYRSDTFVKTEGSVIGETPTYIMDDTSINSNVQPGQPNNMGQLSQGHQSQQPVQQNQGSISQRGHSAMSPDDNITPQPDASLSRRGSLALPSKKPATKPKRQKLQRSHTAIDSEAGSPAPSDTESRPRSGRSGTGRPRRQLIEERLQKAIANGETPMFCTHCGAIETPTWRKLYVKTVDGKPGPLDYAEGEGETIGIETVENDIDTGEATKFIIRKSMKKTKDFQPGQGFEDAVVCNPCGLWFNKFRNMRPPDKWHRRSTTRKKKTCKTDDGPATDGLEPQSEAFFTDQIGAEDALEDSTSADDTQPRPNASAGGAPPLRPRPRANSMQPQISRRPSADGSAGTFQQNMRRETQSSPVRFQGSQESPIEVDLTPAKPTRRLLFPSPRHDGEVKSLEGGASGNSPPVVEKVDNSGKAPVGVGATDVNVYEAFITDKENMMPPLDGGDDLAHLFEGSPSLFRTPLLKTPSKRTPLSRKPAHDLLKTPTQGSRKRKALTPNQNVANNANVGANDFMTSPGSTRYFLRSTPSRLERTPGGRSISGGSQGLGIEPSPFSRHLAQMLSDANGMDEAPFTSPSRQYDFSDLPTFTTPGRNVDWKGLDEILGSEFANYNEHSEAFDSEQPSGDQV